MIWNDFSYCIVSDLTEIAGGKYILDTVKVGERGQMVIPKEARKSLEIKPDDISIVTGDRRKTIITILKANAIKHFALEFARATRKKHQPRKNLEEKDLARKCMENKAIAYALATWVGVHCNNLLVCGFFFLYYFSGSDYS